MSSSNGSQSNVYFLLDLASNPALNVGQSVAVCAFLALIAWPLYRLAKTRGALKIMASKSIVSFVLNVLSALDYSLIWASGKSVYRISVATQLATLLFVLGSCAFQLHILALALNRVHSVYLPFNYVKMAKKGLPLKQCLVVWLVSVLLCAATLWTALAFGPRFSLADDALNSPVLAHLQQCCSYTAALLYVCLVLKLVWLKYSLNKWNNCSEEKDHVRATVACLASMCPFVLKSCVYFGQLSPLFPLPWFRGICLMTIHLAGTLGSCAEELCLLAICAEFRQLLAQQFRHKNKVHNNTNSLVAAKIVVNRPSAVRPQNAK